MGRRGFHGERVTVNSIGIVILQTRLRIDCDPLGIRGVPELGLGGPDNCDGSVGILVIVDEIRGK